MAYMKKLFPQVKEFFFDDDTFTANLPRAVKSPKNSVRSASTGPATAAQTWITTRSSN